MLNVSRVAAALVAFAVLASALPAAASGPRTFSLFFDLATWTDLDENRSEIRLVDHAGVRAGKVTVTWLPTESYVYELNDGTIIAPDAEMFSLANPGDAPGNQSWVSVVSGRGAGGIYTRAAIVEGSTGAYASWVGGRVEMNVEYGERGFLCRCDFIAPRPAPAP